MKFRVSSSQLLTQLKILLGLISSSNALPILDNFLFELQGDQLIITSSDLETTISCKTQVNSYTVGKIAVPARLITDIIKNFDEQTLTFSTRRDTLEITSEQGSYSLPFQNGEEFPKATILERQNMLLLKTNTLLKVINKTLFATSSDEFLLVMTGVLFQLTPEGSTFVATDAHQLVKHVITDLKTEKITEFILPKKPLKLLKNMLTEEGELTIEYNETNTRFIFDQKILTCQLINGKYPNYETVIPKESNKVLTINRKFFLRILKRISIFSNKICFHFNRDQTKIIAEDVDFSNKAQEIFPFDYKGEDITIGFNSKFMIEILSHLRSEEIIFKMSEPHLAGILIPLENEEGEVLMLVMPIMLND